jgi:hypothetical protein
VFFAEQVRVGLPLDTAAVRLANLTRGGCLAGASQRAYRDGTEAMLRVGPLGGAPALAKLVRVRFLDPAWSQRGMSIGFRWEAAGSTTALFPVLDADLVLSPASPDMCALACSGVYRPPLGRIGARSHCRRPAKELAGHTPPRWAGSRPRPGWSQDCVFWQAGNCAQWRAGEPLHGDDDLAAGVSLLEVADDPGELGQRVGPVDHRRDLP